MTNNSEKKTWLERVESVREACKQFNKYYSSLSADFETAMGEERLAKTLTRLENLEHNYGELEKVKIEIGNLKNPHEEILLYNYGKKYPINKNSEAFTALIDKNVSKIFNEDIKPLISNLALHWEYISKKPFLSAEDTIKTLPKESLSVKEMKQYLEEINASPK